MDIGNETGTGYAGDTISNWIGRFWNNISGQTKNAEINSSEAALQRNWETEMASTQYQRAVEDMEKAGLNPAAMYGSSGASSNSVGSGAAASASGSGNGGLLNLIAPIMGSAAKIASTINNAADQSNKNVVRQGELALKQSNSAVQNILRKARTELTNTKTSALKAKIQQKEKYNSLYDDLDTVEI